VKANGSTVTATGRELDVMLAFMGKEEGQTLMILKIKGAKLMAASTSKSAAVEHFGEAEDATNGEWPVSKDFVEDCRALCVDGSENVPARVVRFKLTEEGVPKADIIDPGTGHVHRPIGNDDNLEPTKQFTFAAVSKQIQENKDEGSWFAVDDALVRKAVRVLSAASERCPVTFCPPAENEGGVVLKTEGEGGAYRAWIKCVPTHGPGKAAVASNDDDSDEESDADDEGSEDEETSEDPQNPGPLALKPSPRAKMAKAAKKAGRPKLKHEKVSARKKRK
jgi:hypothetical protein